MLAKNWWLCTQLAACACKICMQLAALDDLPSELVFKFLYRQLGINHPFNDGVHVISKCGMLHISSLSISLCLSSPLSLPRQTPPLNIYET